MIRIIWRALAVTIFISWRQTSKIVEGFVLQNVPCSPGSSSSSSLFVSSSSGLESEDDTSIQWELFNKHHVNGSWKGIWLVEILVDSIFDFIVVKTVDSSYVFRSLGSFASSM